jgi:hypothetical protein
VFSLRKFRVEPPPAPDSDPNFGHPAARAGGCENLFVYLFQSALINDDGRIYRLPKRRALYTMDCLGKPMNRRLPKAVPVFAAASAAPDSDYSPA